MFKSNYGRLEAKYHDIDLLNISLRRALNLAFEFLLEAHQFDSEGWEKNFAPIFAGEDVGDSDELDISHLRRGGLNMG